MKQPCLDCGTVTDGTRCEPCRTIYDRGRYRQQTAARKAKGGRPQYGGGWAAYARAVRATATVCWICGDPAKPGDPWQADHIIPAQQGGGAGPARAAHRSCNIGRGNRTRKQQNDSGKRSPNASTPHAGTPPTP